MRKVKNVGTLTRIQLDVAVAVELLSIYLQL